MIRLVSFIGWRLAENARTRRRSLPRRYVSVSGTNVQISFGEME
jgi:hypothetical protein